MADVEADDEGVEAAYEEAQTLLAEAQEEVERHRQAERDAEKERATQAARREALELGLRRKDGAGALLAAGEKISGLLGSVAALLQVEPGYGHAVAAGLGAAAEAVAVTETTGAVEALDLLRAEDAGQAVIVVGAAPGPPAGAAGAAPPPAPGTRWARALVEAPAPLRPALDRLLDGVVVVPDLVTAREVVDADPALTAVTLDGDVLSAVLARGGSGGAPSLIEVQSAVDEADERIATALRARDRARFELDDARVRAGELTDRVKRLRGQVKDAAARRNAVAVRAGQLTSTLRAATAEADRLAGGVGKADTALAADREALAELEERLLAAEEAAEGVDEPSTAERDTLAAGAASARAAEMEARLALRTAEERARALAGRAGQLLAAAGAEREARIRAAAREERRARRSAAAGAVLVGARHALDLLEVSLEAASRARDEAELARTGAERELSAVRDAVTELTAEQARLVDSVHRDEMARTEKRMRIEALRQRSVEELGIDPEILVEEYGPHQLIPPGPLPAGQPEPDEPAAAETVRARRAGETPAGGGTGPHPARDRQPARP